MSLKQKHPRAKTRGCLIKGFASITAPIIV